MMQDRLTEALKGHGVDYADIRLEDQTSSWVIFRGAELDSIGSGRIVGGIVRALYKGGWGYATFNDLADLRARVQEAAEIARLVGKGETKFAPLEPVVDVIKADMQRDLRSVPLSEKKALAESYNRIVMGHHPAIQASNVRYGDWFKSITFASSEGSYIEEEIPNVYMYVGATARRDDIVQNGFESTGGPEGFQTVEGFEDKARQAAQRAVDLLQAQPVTGGKYTVVTDPRMTGVFTHEAFGHLSEADFISENAHMQEVMQLGKRFGVEGLNILDDGSLPGGLGTHRYDQEGTPMRRNYLVKDGLLVGRLHSRETAAKMGEPLTGNARTVAFQHPPIVRMTNTFIDAGPDTYDDMIKDIELGVLACNYIGGQTAIEMFTFSAAYAYMIRNGAVAELVRDVVLTGNVFETLMHIDRIGNEMGWASNGPGGCGKGDQHPLRVGLGGPYIRIQDCMVGGQA
jgi:TldD protein